MIKTKEDIVKDYELWVYRQLGRLVSSQTTNVGSFISTDGIKLIWSGGGSSLPSQSGNAGKFLTTDGTNTSWATVTAPVWGAITGTLSSQTDLQSALDAKEATANKGAINGYASLDGSGLVPSSQLPSYVDDVLEYADLASLPVTGVTGKIYVTLDSNKSYRWSGSTYVEVSPTLPAGSNTQVQFNNNGVLGGSANLTWDGTILKTPTTVEAGVIQTGSLRGGTAASPAAFSIQASGTSIGRVESTGWFIGGNTSATAMLDILGTSLSGSASTGAVNIAQTWNTTGTPTAIKLNVTNTASTGTPLLMDLQVGGVSQFSVRATGVAQLQSVFAQAGASGTLYTGDSAYRTIDTDRFAIFNGGAGASGTLWYGSSHATLANVIDFKTNGVANRLTINAAGTVSTSTNGAASVPILTSTGTWFSGGTSTTTKPHWLIEPTGTTSTNWSTSGTGLGVNAASGFTGNLLDLQLNGTPGFTVDYAGRVFVNNSLRVGTSNSIYFNNRTALSSAVDGNLKLSNFNNTTFGLLQFGGTTSSFPSIKRNGTALNIRLADDSADAPLTCAAFTASDNITFNGGSVRFNAGTVVDWTGRSAILTPSDGIIQISNNAQNDFSLLRFGGSTSSFPAIKRITTGVEIRLADDSAYTTTKGASFCAATASAVTAALSETGAYNGITLGSDALVRYSSTVDATSGSYDAGLKRSAAGKVQVTDGSTGYGYIEDLYRRVGAGSPEGVVTAPVGAIYHRTDGGANTSLYVKESGAGNTGWIAK